MRIPTGILLLLLVVGATVPAAAQPDDPETPVLRVQGTADVRVPPDLAVVRVGVVSEAETAQEAQTGASAIADAVVAGVREAGVDTRQIQTARITLRPVYAPGRPDEREEPRIVGYRASNVLTVRVERLDRVGPVIDAALDGGANQLEGVSFGLQDGTGPRQDALRQAIAEARGKAAAMAEALGVEIVSIVSVSEDGVFVQEPMMEAARAMSFQADTPTPVSGGEVSISASVSMVYRIR